MRQSNTSTVGLKRAAFSGTQDEPSYIGSVLSMILVATAFSCAAYEVGRKSGESEMQRKAIRVGCGQIVRDMYGNERFVWRAR
jgi:hypothetical protein